MFYYYPDSFGSYFNLISGNVTQIITCRVVKYTNCMSYKQALGDKNLPEMEHLETLDYSRASSYPISITLVAVHNMD